MQQTSGVYIDSITAWEGSKYNVDKPGIFFTMAFAPKGKAMVFMPPIQVTDSLIH